MNKGMLLPTINEDSFSVHQNNVEKGFYNEPRSATESIMLVVTELSEAVEALRKGKRCTMYMDECEFMNRTQFETEVKDTFEDEIADAFIRLMDLCGHMNIPIHQHINFKVEYNKGRPALHGKKF